MLTRRLVRLAEKYGPFVRFFPEGSEEADDADDSKTPDDQAAEDVINEAEPKVEDSAQFKGLLRDAQGLRARASNAEAENAAYKLEIERRDRELAESQKPKDEAPQLTEEEAAQEVTRGELVKTVRTNLAALGKKLSEDFTKALNARESKTTQANIKKNQVADAQALMRTCTAKTKGLTLDAKTVVDEGIAYLSANDPDLLAALSKRPDFASIVYKLATGEPLVPTVGQRVTLRRNTLQAQKLDQGGDDVPGGGAPASDEVSMFESIMSSGEEMSDENFEKMFEP